MSNLDNLISEILKDFEEKSTHVIESAKSKASEIIQENISVAEKEKEQILNSAKIEAQLASEQIILGKKLQIRDDILKAKQSVIDRVFDVALKKLNSMPKNEFLKFICDKLLELEIDGEEIILPSGYQITVKELNEFLVKNNKNGNLKLYSGDRKIDGGFVLLKNGIENNNTFETLIQYYRYELESDIIEKLF